MAVAQIEDVMSLAECDMKLHLLPHAAVHISICGPLHAVSMYPWEATWKFLRPMMTNLAHPETTCMHKHEDLELATTHLVGSRAAFSYGGFRPAAAQPRRSFHLPHLQRTPALDDDEAGGEDAAAAASGAVVLPLVGRCNTMLSLADQQGVHAAYLALSPVAQQLWETFLPWARSRR